MNIPCLGVPLLIGSQLDLHYQSLLPTDHAPARGGCSELDFNEENFPPLGTKPHKKENEKKKDNHESKPQKNRSSHEKQEFNLADIKKKQRELSICPNCQKKFESLNNHFYNKLNV